jgi:hypothetical protein
VSKYIIWEGPGWYAGRSDSKGSRLFRMGTDDSSSGHRTAIDKAHKSGYGSPKWYDAPPSGANKLSLDQYKDLVIERKL